MQSLDSFHKTKDFLVCFDSDGCVMDTMTSKHKYCFGPRMISEWDLERWHDSLLHRWCEINLYSSTRGINRFRGLAIMLREINDGYSRIDGLEDLIDWVEGGEELSNGALKAEIARKPDSKILKKTLSWSIAANKDASELPMENKLPFPCAREAVEISHYHANVALLSSADPSALSEEWENQDMAQLVDVMLSQKDGKKEKCLKRLIKKGYSHDRVIMCGDSPGDLAAAEATGVFFFPIIFNKEEKSWDEFIFEGLPKLISFGYGGEYQEKKIREFKENMKSEEEINGKS